MTHCTIYPPMSVEEWLRLRATGIGASEAAAILGLDPYCTPLELHLRKRGEIEPARETEAMRIGKAMEPVLEELYLQSAKLGWGTIERINRQLFARSVSYPWMLATIDLRVNDTIVELKTVGSRSPVLEYLGEDDTDQIPPWWAVQAHHQMAVFGIDVVHFAVLVGGQRFRTFRVEANEEIRSTILEQTAVFWDRVETGIPPDPTHKESAAVLAKLWPNVVGSVELGSLGSELTEQYEHLTERLKAIEAMRAEVKRDLLAVMREAEYGTLPDGRRWRRKQCIRTAHMVPESTYIDLRLLKGRKGGHDGEID